MQGRCTCVASACTQCVFRLRTRGRKNSEDDTSYVTVTLTPDALTHAVVYMVRRKMAAVEENFRAFVARKKLEYSLKFPFLKESQIVAKLRRIWTNQRANCSTASLSGKFLWFHCLVRVLLFYCFTSYMW